MRLNYTLFFTLFILCCNTNGQTFSAYKVNASATSTLTGLTNGSMLFETTSVTTNTASPSFNVVKLNLVNNSTTTLTLNIIRQIEFNSPPLLLNGSNGLPDTYFSFGNTVFPSNVSTAGSSDYIILGTAGSTLTPLDNSIANGYSSNIYLNEDVMLGSYSVRYKLYNVNNVNDTLSFLIKYNATLDLGNFSYELANHINLYPNPSENTVLISFNGVKEKLIDVTVYDAQGKMIETINCDSFLHNKSSFTLDVSSYHQGIYQCIFTTEASKITKRMVINK